MISVHIGLGRGKALLTGLAVLVKLIVMWIGLLARHMSDATFVTVEAKLGSYSAA